MPRITDERREARREQVLDAARACLHEHGLEAVSMEMIIARSGLSTGAVLRLLQGQGRHHQRRRDRWNGRDGPASRPGPEGPRAATGRHRGLRPRQARRHRPPACLPARAPTSRRTPAPWTCSHDDAPPTTRPAGALRPAAPRRASLWHCPLRPDMPGLTPARDPQVSDGEMRSSAARDCQAAIGAVRTALSFLGERYYGIARRRGKAKAQVAVARPSW